MPLAAAESVVRAWLEGQFPGVLVVTETDNDLANELPCIEVTRFGGADSVLTIDAANLDIEVYDGPRGGLSARENARNLAEEVRASLRLNLPGQTVAGATVAAVATISAPSWAPYDNTDLRRFRASYRVTIKSTL